MLVFTNTLEAVTGDSEVGGQPELYINNILQIIDENVII